MGSNNDDSNDEYKEDWVGFAKSCFHYLFFIVAIGLITSCYHLYIPGSSEKPYFNKAMAFPSDIKTYGFDIDKKPSYEDVPKDIKTMICNLGIPPSYSSIYRSIKNKPEMKWNSSKSWEYAFASSISYTFAMTRGYVVGMLSVLTEKNPTAFGKIGQMMWSMIVIFLSICIALFVAPIMTLVMPTFQSVDSILLTILVIIVSFMGSFIIYNGMSFIWLFYFGLGTILPILLDQGEVWRTFKKFIPILFWIFMTLCVFRSSQFLDSTTSSAMKVVYVLLLLLNLYKSFKKKQ